LARRIALLPECISPRRNAGAAADSRKWASTLTKNGWAQGRSVQLGISDKLLGRNVDLGANSSEQAEAMKSTRYRRDRIGNHILKPETMMRCYGYDPALSEGAVKPPVFLTSTFVFRSAEEGQRLLQSRRRTARAGIRVDPGLVYSRFNHPKQRDRRGSAGDL